jgi:hypothetical protein
VFDAEVFTRVQEVYQGIEIFKQEVFNLIRIYEDKKIKDLKSRISGKKMH